MDWLVTYKYENVERHLKLQARTVPNIQVVAFRAVMEVFGEAPPVSKVAGQPVLEWMRACGVDITDVILLRRTSRRASEGEEGHAP
ncbi:hypothetical protein [Pseudomonas turukhanskensis]|uniref:Uncharacterized protein n=1 Tax=Pseudomonas turukhanskensis TaxID=1806536 RepID=A0A9W6NGF0_9PSED|nr:hypothetical protein [Pseudomonas turukhanskensis]GLK89772.1 hypothetical protein GCM10017655_28340 [Pseudomonas turukhanskensis]